jgi:hypothetical protein
VAYAFGIELVKLVAPIYVSVRILPLNTFILVSPIAREALRKALIIRTISSVNMYVSAISVSRRTRTALWIIPVPFMLE